ncbi:unnamed protein product [Choristocarpus tenellus]
MLDLLSSARRPLQNLLKDCPFSEWEGLALFLDDGATEAVRWAGGIPFVLDELGISTVLDLQIFAPGREHPVTQGSTVKGVKRGIFLVTTFLWDVESAVLGAARAFELDEVVVACTVSEEGHACHPHASQLTEDTGGVVSFTDLAAQLKVS